MLITLPLPHKHLSPNARCHWAALASAKKKSRYDGYLAAKAAMGAIGERGGWKIADVYCTFYFKDRRRRDADNLLASLKAALDGIADSGLIQNDCGFIHHPVTIEVSRSAPRVTVRIDRRE